MRFGLIADTHDQLPSRVLELLDGVDGIFHLGDVCRATIIHSLAAVAPVSRVRGNCDHGPWALEAPKREVWPAGALLVYGIHDLSEMDVAPQHAGISIVLFGHTHRPVYAKQHGCIYANPGSAGAPRHGHPATVAMLHVDGTAARLEWRRVDTGASYQPESRLP